MEFKEYMIPENSDAFIKFKDIKKLDTFDMPELDNYADVDNLLRGSTDDIDDSYLLPVVVEGVYRHWYEDDQCFWYIYFNYSKDNDIIDVRLFEFNKSEERHSYKFKWHGTLTIDNYLELAKSSVDVSNVDYKSISKYFVTLDVPYKDVLAVGKNLDYFYIQPLCIFSYYNFVVNYKIRNRNVVVKDITPKNNSNRKIKHANDEVVANNPNNKKVITLGDDLIVYAHDKDTIKTIKSRKPFSGYKNKFNVRGHYRTCHRKDGTEYKVYISPYVKGDSEKNFKGKQYKINKEK